MKALQQIPRNALVWMIISMFALVAPHTSRIPLWILGLYAVAALWRIMVYRGRWSFPGRLHKALLVVAGFAGIFLSFGNLLGLEPTVALLLTAFAFKLVELAQRKDAYVLLFLAYFICATEFLFSQDILLVLYMLLCVALITTALVALHQPGQHSFNRRTIRHSLVMLGQALPLMVVLFFLFPRIDPLWNVPIKSHSARTGVSDFMRPGDISNLSQSAEVAFRVQFEGEIPERSQLYWRGLVFSKLQEGAWTSLKYYEVPAEQRLAPKLDPTGTRLAYSVIMEPTQQNWLYSLRYAQPQARSVMATPDYLLFSPVELEDDLIYEAVSWPDVTLDESLTEWRRRIETRLLGAANPRLRAYARDLRAQVGSDSELVQRLLREFNQQNFVYTLQPPLLGQDSMDQFLFDTRRGFCEHYASSFVMMMRAAGVPARVVAGYQGGEVNPVNRTVIVHQFDAHAWAEVWIQGEGWVRVDPTAAVAPDRIEWGLERAMQEEGSFLEGSPFSPLRFRSVIWLNSLRLRYDALTYRWQTWVVGFNSQEQLSLLEGWFGDIEPRKFAMILLGSWTLFLIPVAASLLFRRKRHTLQAQDKYYLKFCKRMAALGVPREPGEAPGDYAARAAAAMPRHKAELYRVTELYVQLAYSGRADNKRSQDSLLRDLKLAAAGGRGLS